MRNGPVDPVPEITNIVIVQGRGPETEDDEDGQDRDLSPDLLGSVTPTGGSRAAQSTVLPGMAHSTTTAPGVAGHSKSVPVIGLVHGVSRITSPGTGNVTVVGSSKVMPRIPWTCVERRV